MSEFKTVLKGSQVSPQVRARILAQVYAAILSWSYPQEDEIKPPATGIDQNEEVVSGMNAPASDNKPAEKR
jgi:hypothetical protein